MSNRLERVMILKTGFLCFLTCHFRKRKKSRFWILNKKTKNLFSRIVFWCEIYIGRSSSVVYSYIQSSHNHYSVSL